MLIVATSSITHNFVLSDRESIERFIEAVESSKHDVPKPRISYGRLLTDRREITELMNNVR